MEIDLNELERLANAAHKYNNFWFEKDDLEDLNIGSDDAALIARMSHDVVLELVRRLRTAEAEAVKSERRAIAFGDIVHQFTIAMRAAVVAAHLEGPDHGMQWIYNTLAGPGHLPDLDDARALGGAQAMFDAEMAEHEAFRAAHPAPAIQSPKVGDCTEVKPS